MAELLPCPFCGEKLVQDECGNWEHIANDCILSWLDSEYGKIFFGNCEEDIRAWNTRTPKERGGEVIDMNKTFFIEEAVYRMPYHELDDIRAFVRNHEWEDIPESIQEHLEKWEEFLIENL